MNKKLKTTEIMKDEMCKGKRKGSGGIGNERLMKKKYH
jgi:hypothetical protein